MRGGALSSCTNADGQALRRSVSSRPCAPLTLRCVRLVGWGVGHGGEVGRRLVEEAILKATDPVSGRGWGGAGPGVMGLGAREGTQGEA